MEIVKYSRRSALIAIAFAALLNAMTGCASFKTYFYTFAFDVTRDNQDAIVLDYKYTLDGETLVGAYQDYVEKQIGFPGESNFGRMPIGDSLYFKWKIISTGMVYEKSVSLKGRLGEDMSGKRVYPMVNGSRLLVYLISNESRDQGAPLIGPTTFQDYKIKLVYP
jgi:hypothetical protein